MKIVQKTNLVIMKGNTQKDSQYSSRKEERSPKAVLKDRKKPFASTSTNKVHFSCFTKTILEQLSKFEIINYMIFFEISYYFFYFAICFFS